MVFCRILIVSVIRFGGYLGFSVIYRCLICFLRLGDLVRVIRFCVVFVVICEDFVMKL